jgi:hypothetical protein
MDQATIDSVVNAVVKAVDVKMADAVTSAVEEKMKAQNEEIKSLKEQLEVKGLKGKLFKKE